MDACIKFIYTIHKRKQICLTLFMCIYLAYTPWPIAIATGAPSGVCPAVQAWQLMQTCSLQTWQFPHAHFPHSSLLPLLSGEATPAGMINHIHLPGIYDISL